MISLSTYTLIFNRGQISRPSPAPAGHLFYVFGGEGKLEKWSDNFLGTTSQPLWKQTVCRRELEGKVEGRQAKQNTLLVRLQKTASISVECFVSLFSSGLFKGSRIWGGRPRPVFLLARSVFAWDDLPPDRPTARYARKTTPRRRPSEEITWESVYEHNTHTLSWGPSTESSTK